MDHREIKKLIGAYADGELHGKEKKAVEEHITTCDECARELAYIKKLNESIKADRISLPAEAYWDTFPRRVIERAQGQRQQSFFTVWLPRMKWELAGGIVLLLLTFVVSKQILMKRSVEDITLGKRHTFVTESVTEEEYFTKDGTGMPEGAVSGKAMDEVAEKEKEMDMGAVRTVSGEEEAPAPEETPDVAVLPKTAATITKGGADIDDKEVREDEVCADAEVAKAGELTESIPIEANKAAKTLEKKAPVSKAEETEGEAEIVAGAEGRDESAARFAQVSERSQHARRGLLRLLYDEADRTRKRVDIERAMREIEFYQDSYPEDFQDTLVIFIDSLQQMIEEVERQEAEQAPAETNETE